MRAGLFFGPRSQDSRRCAACPAPIPAIAFNTSGGTAPSLLPVIAAGGIELPCGNIPRLLLVERGESWWNERKPDQPVSWESKTEPGEEFFQAIIRHPAPFDRNTRIGVMHRQTLSA